MVLLNGMCEVWLNYWPSSSRRKFQKPSMYYIYTIKYLSLEYGMTFYYLVIEQT